MNSPTNNPCDRLDDFLDGALLPQEAREFDAHRAHCAACRDAVEQQQWIDGLLRSPVAASLEAAPVAAAIPFRTHSRTPLVVAAMAAALAAVAATLLLSFPRRDGSNRARSPVATERRAIAEADSDSATLTTGANRSPSPPVAASGSFVSAGSAIAVPLASGDPQVTIVQLYPTVTAQRRWARQAAMRSAAISPNGG